MNGGQTQRENIRMLAIGAAVQDVFLRGKIFTPKKSDPEYVEEFVLGSKNNVDGVMFGTGGGAVNASVTFARQGLFSMFMGKVGDDIAGKEVLDGLHRENVDTSLVKVTKEHSTGFSCLLVAPNGERTILTHRGASSHLEFKIEDFNDTEADWMFITSFAGHFGYLRTVLDYAESKGMKVAMIPGKDELKQIEKLKEILPRLEVVIANKNELQMIYPGETLEELVREASKDVHYVCGTDGPNGAVATDRWHIVTAGMYEDVKVVDRTGAGDAFASGFVAMIASGETLEWAITYASANSTSVVKSIGTQEGILYRDADVHEMPLIVKEL